MNVNYTFDINGALVVDVESLINSKGFREQVEAAAKLKDLQEKSK